MRQRCFEEYLASFRILVSGTQDTTTEYINFSRRRRYIKIQRQEIISYNHSYLINYLNTKIKIHQNTETAERRTWKWESRDYQKEHLNIRMQNRRPVAKSWKRWRRVAIDEWEWKRKEKEAKAWFVLKCYRRRIVKVICHKVESGTETVDGPYNVRYKLHNWNK